MEAVLEVVPLREVHKGQTVYPIAEESDADTIVAMCDGARVEFGVEDLETLEGEPLARCLAA